MRTTDLKQRLGQLKDDVRIARETWQDGWRHIRYSAAVDRRSSLSVGLRQLEAQITRDYHRIEKGLALRAPRSDFGTAVAERLARDVVRYEALPGHDRRVVAHAASALAALRVWRTEGRRLEDDGPTRPPPQGVSLTRSQAEAFFRSRVSVRDYDGTPVPAEVVRTAADLALSSPSVCNRQAWALWAFHEREDIERIAALQNGNAGFREQIPCLLIVAVDARLFSGSGERNQRWVDGGLYAMSLVWALHALGVGSCMLNWSVDHGQTRRLRAMTGIPDHLDVITMIAAGYPREGLRVARSPRRPVDSVLHSDAPTSG
ncbi:nitroreductase family protein [Geodermatophilus sp. DF01-2]|uniref:nitroreductase family protein n=1 Tax=Geodermatophilus sp. DF01-2 TaxID=2559610 RepID=UPI001073ABBD|nr:nitroreductase family protein [Geodermatophilus sp. DF01_2]TFV64676.1 nitroreductase family protein [Geodermatophilus sp. DF01_2]